MKKYIISAAIIAAVGISAYLGLRPAPTSALTELQLANAEALSDLEQIDGNWYIIDQIPCASSSNEILIHLSYVNCSNCKSQHGGKNVSPETNKYTSF